MGGKWHGTRLSLGCMLLEMLLGMLEFLLFHESTEDVKDVSLTDMRMESIEGYGNGGSLCDVFSFVQG